LYDGSTRVLREMPLIRRDECITNDECLRSFIKKRYFGTA